MMKVKRIGLDLAKNIFQIHGVDIDEQTIVRQRLKRVAVLSKCSPYGIRDKYPPKQQLTALTRS